ncbi:hypothetical protein [Angustibacter luteus]|uniref:Secreted protein n=1 Tax=Angustibacter luteus TaxID=658456 RepID=A0ABW1JF22_9ACTN
MTGMHRGRRGLRWRLVVAVLSSAVGRGYAGRHRLADVALGVQESVSAPVLPAVGTVEADESSRVLVAEAAPDALVSARQLPAAPMVVQGARLAVVQVASSPDPLVDTMPHPVVKLFPMAVEEIHDAVFAGEDAEREQAAVVDLAAAEGAGVHEYHGRHTA